MIPLRLVNDGFDDVRKDLWDIIDKDRAFVRSSPFTTQRADWDMRRFQYGDQGLIRRLQPWSAWDFTRAGRMIR